jgi:hypothetical protein
MSFTGLNMGTWVALGIIFGTTLFVSTGEVFWIGVGVAVGTAFGVGADVYRRLQ